MTTQNETKINHLLQLLPNGSVATTTRLHELGISLGLISKYVSGGWFDRLGVGAVVRRGSKVGWQGAIYALQNQLGLSVHPAGKTALGLHGSLHYLPFGQERVTLFYRNKENLPKWFSQHDWSVQLQLIKSDLFGDDDSLGLTDVPTGEFSLKVSSNERAVLEYLHLLESDNPGDEPMKLMEGLAWLRPDFVQRLLEICRSVKVNRLFLVLADQANHPWLKKLLIKKIDLGKGKRQFVSGGYMHPHYLITVPKSWRRTEQAA
jgi:hypothetical protein